MKPVLFLFLLVLAILTPPSSHADLVTEQAFSFGKISIIDNSVVSTVQLSSSGRASSTNNIYILELGTPGVYTLTDLPPFTVVTLSANLPAYSASTLPSTQQFAISSVDMPATIKADAAGSAQFRVGGVLETSGLGGQYIGPATYQIMLPIEVTY
ncbi:DUF4402 domain-containing protein [Aestuariibacter sp. AA17]|uniref:DUF4402 domain-containing protein n=1 Tax=Fluctibacter corallii TaxID=2984329 RepID=A0ABT3AB44_9ALTE|nr:DUF4402 domain-containing protein [Aestuariibacter sp. AA17]MCV2885897.1 DUF4402 domain-containing protein [Aestuariibacter sp. AA17]